MTEETRDLFLSVACDTGSVHENTGGKCSFVASPTINPGKHYSGVNAGDGSKRRFFYPAGRAQAWTAIENWMGASEGAVRFERLGENNFYLRFAQAVSCRKTCFCFCVFLFRRLIFLGPSETTRQ